MKRWIFKHQAGETFICHHDLSFKEACLFCFLSINRKTLHVSESNARPWYRHKSLLGGRPVHLSPSATFIMRMALELECETIRHGKKRILWFSSMKFQKVLSKDFLDNWCPHGHIGLLFPYQNSCKSTLGERFCNFFSPPQVRVS